MSTNQTTLESRYGRKRIVSRDKQLLRILGIIIGVVVVAWVIWVAFDDNKPTVDAIDTGHSVIDDSTVSVRFEVSVAAGTTTHCSVQALNENFAVVGYKVIELPPSESFTRSITETLRTTEPANTGLVNRCWLT